MMVRRNGRRSEIFLSKLRICQGKASFHSFEKLAFMSAQLCILDQKKIYGNVSDCSFQIKHLSVDLLFDSRPTD